MNIHKGLLKMIGVDFFSSAQFENITGQIPAVEYYDCQYLAVEWYRWKASRYQYFKRKQRLR